MLLLHHICIISTEIFQAVLTTSTLNPVLPPIKSAYAFIILNYPTQQYRTTTLSTKPLEIEPLLDHEHLDSCTTHST